MYKINIKLFFPEFITLHRGAIGKSVDYEYVSHEFESHWGFNLPSQTFLNLCFGQILLNLKILKR